MADFEDTPGDEEDSIVRHTGGRQRQENDVTTRDGSLVTALARARVQQQEWKEWGVRGMEWE